MKILSKILGLCKKKHNPFIVKVGDFIYDTIMNEWVFVWHYNSSNDIQAFMLSNGDMCTYDGWSESTETYRYRSSSKPGELLPIIKYNDIVEFIHQNKKYKGYYENYKELIDEYCTSIRYFNIIKTNVR